MDLENSMPVDWLTARVSKNISSQEWDKLIEALPVAEEQGVSVELLEKGWTLSGDYLFNKSEWVGAVLAYNKVRKFNPNTIYAFDRIIDSINLFYTQNKILFSRNDLENIIHGIQSVVNYYEMNSPGAAGIKIARELFQRMDYSVKFVAIDSVETPVTFRVNQIVNALDKDVPMKQVHQDIAKIILPLIREKITNKEQKKKSVSKKA